METQVTTKKRFKTYSVYISILQDFNDAGSYDALELVNESLSIRDFLYTYLNARGCKFVKVNLLNDTGLMKVSFGGGKVKANSLKEEIQNFCTHDGYRYFESYPFEKEKREAIKRRKESAIKERNQKETGDILDDLIKDIKERDVKDIGSENV